MYDMSTHRAAILAAKSTGELRAIAIDIIGNDSLIDDCADVEHARGALLEYCDLCEDGGPIDLPRPVLPDTVRFARFWTGSYETDADICGASEVTEENGYEPFDIDCILSLPIGGKYDASMPITSAIHYLIRVA